MQRAPPCDERGARDPQDTRVSEIRKVDVLTAPTPQPRAVGRDHQARRITAGAIVLIEAHLVDAHPVGAGREVVAIVTRNTPADGGRVREIRWTGACPGHDGQAPTEGVTVYEASSSVTVLGRVGGAA